MYRFIRAFLFIFPPEIAHRLSLLALKFLYVTGILRAYLGKPLSYPVKAMGLTFNNPVGLAAGLDKNAEHIDELAACGFGFIEVGTVTPEGQPGNPRPRLFRLKKDRAIINRMGFNNRGVKYLVKQVKKSRKACLLGINIGKNRATALEDAARDYLYAFNEVYDYADYIVINISSPNTPGLRQLQYGEKLVALLTSLKDEQNILQKKYNRYVPLAVKVAPDLSDEEIQHLSGAFLSCGIDGVIATNTTNQRPDLYDSKKAGEEGGLSGEPLRDQSTHVIKQFNKHLNNRIPIIAVGGIMSADDAKEKIDAGASLVQLYSGFIYEGPQLINDCIRKISIT